MYCRQVCWESACFCACLFQTCRFQMSDALSTNDWQSTVLFFVLLLRTIFMSTSIVQHTFLFHNLFLWCKGIAVVFFMQLCWIFKINLKNPSILYIFFFLQEFFLCGHYTFPFKIPCCGGGACSLLSRKGCSDQDTWYNCLVCWGYSLVPAGCLPFCISCSPLRFHPEFPFQRRDAFLQYVCQELQLCSRLSQ